jgi:CheY-like chemotaxis protein
MTGGVAHDFNNLLTVILGSAEMLDRRADDPARVHHIANQIMLAARRGGEVTQQLLAFSRRQLVKPETVDLNQCLLVFKPLLDRAAQEPIRVELDLQPNLDAVRLDPGHFEAAVLNLVGNARHAMPQGGRIVISTRNIRQTVPQATTAHPDLPPGHYVRVAVTDSGSGMDATTAAKAFEPFFTTKEVGKGTGLGLSQVYGFAKQAGGDVRIVSALGEGTTVELLLPREEQPTARATATAAAPLRDVSGEVVLVVEDEVEVREVVVDCLHELGYGTLEASNGPAALDMLRSGQRVDVLFSDVVMPGGMDGFRLRTEARRLRPGLKVLLTSGYPGSFDRTQDADVTLLTKPYDRSQLASYLSSVLQT